MDRVKRIWYLSPMRAVKVQASLRIRAVSPEPSLLAHTSSESRGTFRQKARSLAPLNGWACPVEICHDGMLEDTNLLAKNWCFLLARFAHYTLVILLIICILHLMNPSPFKYIRVIHQEPFQFRQKGWGHSVGCSQYSTISVCPCNEPAHEIMELIRACAVSPEQLLFAHMKYRSRRRVRQKIGHLARLDGCTCTFEEWVYGGWKMP